MAMSWAQKKQLKIFIFIAIFAFAVVGLIIYSFRPAPSCTDGKLNQKEEQIDCGGECDACIGSPRELSVLWARPFEISEGHYEVGALIDNPNSTVGARSLSYVVKLFEGSTLVGQREGRTFLNPREKFLIYESDIATVNIKPTRASIEIKEVPWKVFKVEKANILISSKIFETAPSGNGRVKIVLENQTLFPIDNIYMSVILTDSIGSVVGVSQSKVDSIAGEASQELFLTWRHAFDPAPANIDVYLRTDLTR
jgi:hypothetical protein